MSLDRASTETRRWIDWLRAELSELPYTETPVWADFRDRGTGEVIAHVRKNKSSLVAYLKLEAGDDPDLVPASTDWDFPSNYAMRGANNLPKAKDLILRADEHYRGSGIRGRTR